VMGQASPSLYFIYR
jgi:hypothetical protein